MWEIPRRSLAEIQANSMLELPSSSSLEEARP